MEELIERKKDIKDVKMMSPLTWAYIGDCVYELYVRQELINKTNLKPNKLHIEAINYVKASKQAEILKKIMDKLSEEEQDIISFFLSINSSISNTSIFFPKLFFLIFHF